MQFATIAFGPEEQWRPMLDRWLFRYDRHVRAPLIIATDGASPWVRKYERDAEIVQMDDLPPHRNALNLVGLLMARLALVASPCLVVTLDCEICGDIRLGDEWWMQSAIALGQDPYFRSYPDLGILQEYNCGVQWCGAPHIGARFLELWAEHYDDPRATEIPYWDQVIWSKVWWECANTSGAALYPADLNYSHLWPMDETVKIRHYHGTAAKKRMNDQDEGSAPSTKLPKSN